MNIKAELMDKKAMERALMRISHEIIEQSKGVEDVCIVGIHRRGVNIAKKLVDNIEKIEGIRPLFGELDITLYRDDLKDCEPVLKGSTLNFDITDKTIVLVDDVLYTGRTTRAAIDAIMDRGRPKRVELAVLIDRGHRELPIRADYIGKNVPTSHDEKIAVCVEEIDGIDKVLILSK